MKLNDFGVIFLLLLAAAAFYGMNQYSDGQLERDAKAAVHDAKDAAKGAVEKAKEAVK